MKRSLFLALTLLSGCGARTALEAFDAESRGGAPSGGSGAATSTGGSTSTGGATSTGGSFGMAGVAAAPMNGGTAGQPSPALEIISIIDGDSDLNLRDLAVGPESNLALVGDYSGPTYFGPSWVLGYTQGGWDSWAATVDPSGTTLSVSTAGSIDDDALNAVAYDAQGITAAGYPATNLLRIGSPEWAQKTFDGAINEDVALALTGDIVTVGAIVGDADLGGGNLSSSGHPTAFVASYDTFGNWRWNRIFPGSDSMARDVIVDTSGNAVVAGAFTSDLEIGPFSFYENGPSNVFIARLDPTGTANFASAIDGNIEPAGLTLTSDGGFALAVTGRLGTTGSSSAMVVRHDSLGNALWSVVIQSTRDVEATGIAFSAHDEILLTGMFSGTLDTPFASTAPDPAPTNPSPPTNFDGFVIALDHLDGSILWERTIGGKGYQRISAIAVDTTLNASSGAIYLGGTFDEALDVNGTPYVPQSTAGNLFIARLTP